MKRTTLIVGLLLAGMAIFGAGCGPAEEELPPGDAPSGVIEEPQTVDEDPPPPAESPEPPPPEPAPSLALSSTEVWWDIGEAECVATGETLVPTLTLCVVNDGDGPADANLLAAVVEASVAYGGTPYDETFASEPLAPGEERCLSATFDPPLLAEVNLQEFTSLPGVEDVVLDLPDLPPVCEPEVAAPSEGDSLSTEGQFTEQIDVYDCQLVGDGIYQWYSVTGIFQILDDGTKAFVGVVDGSQQGPFTGPWQGGCTTGGNNSNTSSSSGGSTNTDGEDGGDGQE